MEGEWEGEVLDNGVVSGVGEILHREGEGGSFRMVEGREREILIVEEQGRKGER